MELVSEKSLPESTRTFMTLLSDYNLTVDDVDVQMHKIYPDWEMGETSRMLRKHPILSSTTTETRIVAMRAAGLSKRRAFEVIADAHSAEKDGEADHDVRLKAADRALALMGEKMNAPIVIARDINIQISSPEEVDRLEKIAEMMDTITQRMNLKKIETIDAKA